MAQWLWLPSFGVQGITLDYLEPRLSELTWEVHVSAFDSSNAIYIDPGPLSPFRIIMPPGDPQAGLL